MPEDRSVENKVIVLMLLQKAQERGRGVLTRIQVHKLLFVLERQMWRQKALSTSFRFIRMQHGPWSQDIEKTLTQLEDLGLVQTQRVSTLKGDYAKLASLTETGSELVRSIVEIPSGETEDMVMQAIDAAIVEYGSMPSEELATASHDFLNPVTGKTVHDTPLHQYLLKPKSRKQATRVLEVEESVRETLEVMEDRELHDSLLSSIEQARKGMFRPYRPGGVTSTNEKEGRCN